MAKQIIVKQMTKERLEFVVDVLTRSDLCKNSKIESF